MTSRALPESLTSVLKVARGLEAQARGTHRERSAIAATSALLLAAHEAGWQQLELARFLQMPVPTVHKRIANARRDRPGASGIVVDQPLDRPPRPLALLRAPASEREWLTVSEAAVHVQRSEATIRNWLRRGVLPNTDRSSPGTYLYLRADLDRVMTAVRRRPGGVHVDYAWLTEQIAAASI